MWSKRALLGPLTAILATAIFGSLQSAHAQDAGLQARLLAAINGYRISFGLPPYAQNPLLTLSAQRHSEYQASIGQWTHEEPDGSRALQRAQAVGYPAIRANENVFAGNGSPEEVANWWFTADQDHRNNILHTVLREIGLGIASDASGQIYWTMDISAQPNVLPIFINSDAYSTSDPNVTLTLWNEGVFYGNGQIGQATQVMISNSPDFSVASAQPWAQTIPWALDTSTGSGAKTVYVKFIDSAGMTATSQDSIAYDNTGGNSAPVIPPIVLFPTPAPPQPTIVPVVIQPQPAILPTLQDAAIPTENETIIASPALPTPDFSVFRVTPPSVPVPGEPSQRQILGMAVNRLRDILVGTLASGIGFITLGLLALIRSWKSARALAQTPKEEPADGED